MLSPEDRAQWKADRKAVEAYWSSGQAEPFILDRREAYCVCDVLFPGLWARLRMETRCFLMSLIHRIPFSSVRTILYRTMGMKIGSDVYIAPGVELDRFYPWLIELEDGAFLGLGCRIFAHEYTATHFRIGRVRIGKGTVIGAYATVRSGTTIGRKVTVGFNSYVNKDVPDNAVVGGVPARPLTQKP